MADGNLLYLDLAVFDDGKVLRGGALVVDATTEPLEFRCTDGVRPTKLQRILWGARLDGYLATDLVGKPLIKSLRQDVSLVLVREANFLGLREGVDIPVVQLSRDTAIQFTEPRSSDEDTHREGTDHSGDGPADGLGGDSGPSILTNPSGNFEPIVLRCHDHHREDMELARSVLRPLFLRRDVMEPFERISTALDVIHSQDKKEAGGGK